MSMKAIGKAKKKLPKKDSPLGKMNSKDTASVLTQLIQAKKEYEMCVEKETTKRKEIESNMVMYLETLKLKRDIVFSVLEEQYKLRKESIENLYELLDKAYEDGRDDVVIQAISSIEGIIKESPAKDLLNIEEGFRNPDKTLTI